MKVVGKLVPLRDNVLVSDMDFGARKTASGIFVPGDDGKNHGIHPRWGRVFAIGPDQGEVKVGEWVLIEHGRWTRTIELEAEDGSIVELRMVDNKAIMLSADEPANDILWAN